MFGLRSKLTLGFGGLVLIMLFIGIQGILRVNELGQSVDVILRENYRSVIACQEMKESLERVDSAVLFVLLGYEPEGRAQIDQYMAAFGHAMQTEGANLTLPDEGEAFRNLQASYAQYQRCLDKVTESARPVEARRLQYFSELLPLFQSVKERADQILRMNQQNMSDANMAARENAAQASQRMHLLLICGFVVASVFIFSNQRWILRPITRLTASANEIAQGNLDLVIGSKSRDEMGQLAAAFDAMASSLREYRRANEAKLLNLQRATQQALESLSAAIVVVDLDDNVSAVTKGAHDAFGVAVGDHLPQGGPAWMGSLVHQAVQTGRHETLPQGDDLIQVFVAGQERFYRPEAIPVLDAMGQPAGITLILHDATQTRQQDELKRGLVSTVSHQLKTPLTSIRMALYLLLDDQIGPLTLKQEELLLAAREDSDRLQTIVDDLLDIARIQSGRLRADFQSLDSALLAAGAVDSFRSEAQDRGITLVLDVPPGLPDVHADPVRVPHVFANLLSNALRYTSPGGSVTVSARADDHVVWYSVNDTGVGIPSEYLERVFEQFFRVPDQGGPGAGLGLAISKEIVMAHGGSIRAESIPEKGSRFSFSLKRADATNGREETA